MPGERTALSVARATSVRAPTWPGGNALEPSYPEGNFEGNQLLGGSIGLSPLCQAQATQFARQNRDWPPPQFPTASPLHGIVHHLSGPLDLASTQNPVQSATGPVSHADVMCARLPQHTPSLGWLGIRVAFTMPHHPLNCHNRWATFHT